MAQFTNQATLSYNGSVVNSNVAVGEILEALSAQKTAVRETYVAGDTITYVISLRNAGAAAWTGLTVSDDLGAYAFGTPAETVYPLEYVAPSIQYYSNGVLQAKPTVTAGPPLVISGISVPAGMPFSSMRQKPHRMRRRAWKHPLPIRRRLPATPSHR